MVRGLGRLLVVALVSCSAAPSDSSASTESDLSSWNWSTPRLGTIAFGQELGPFDQTQATALSLTFSAKVGTSVKITVRSDNGASPYATLWGTSLRRLAGASAAPGQTSTELVFHDLPIAARDAPSEPWPFQVTFGDNRGNLGGRFFVKLETAGTPSDCAPAGAGPWRAVLGTCPIERNVTIHASQALRWFQGARDGTSVGSTADDQTLAVSFRSEGDRILFRGTGPAAPRYSRTIPGPGGGMTAFRAPWFVEGRVGADGSFSASKRIDYSNGGTGKLRLHGRIAADGRVTVTDYVSSIENAANPSENESLELVCAATGCPSGAL